MEIEQQIEQVTCRFGLIDIGKVFQYDTATWVKITAETAMQLGVGEVVSFTKSTRVQPVIKVVTIIKG